MKDNESALDPTHGRAQKTDMSLAMEFHLFKRYPTMERFTIEWALRRAFDAVAVHDGLDAVSSEWSGALSLDYYPFVSPGISQTNIFFVGTTVRMGRTKLHAPGDNSQAVYNANSFLGLRSGIKYNFESGFGVRLMASYENLNLDKTEANNVGNNLPDIINYGELKFSAGMTYFF